jgi:hypothetical protein
MFAMNCNISFSFGLFSIILVACVVTGTGKLFASFINYCNTFLRERATFSMHDDLYGYNSNNNDDNNGVLMMIIMLMI